MPQVEQFYDVSYYDGPNGWRGTGEEISETELRARYPGAAPCEHQLLYFPGARTLYFEDLSFEPLF
jgi:hypothetical protein